VVATLPREPAGRNDYGTALWRGVLCCTLERSTAAGPILLEHAFEYIWDKGLPSGVQQICGQANLTNQVLRHGSSISPEPDRRELLVIGTGRPLCPVTESATSATTDEIGAVVLA
jgi:hypothetical protein